MECLSRLFRNSSEAKGQIQQCEKPDEIYPVHFLDHIGTIGETLISFTFQYDDVLDPEKLRDSLTELLEIEGWRKLGGRLRRNKDGRIEIHVPQTYSEERPAVEFSHVKSDLSIEDHPLGCRLPKRSGNTPSIHDGDDTFRPFSVPQDFPKSREMFFKTDRPLLTLHITSFTNATLVSLAFPHVAFDAMGASELVRAWSNVLHGRADLVPMFMSAWDDALDSVGTDADEKAQTPGVTEDKQLKGLALLTFGVRFVWDVLTRTIQSRTILFPAEFVSQLRQEVQEQLGLGPETKQPVFVSDGDLIAAWCSRMIMSSRSKKRPATIINVFDLRSRLENTFTSEGSYIQNLFSGVYTTLSPDEASSMSVSQLALRLRQGIVEQTTDAQARSTLRQVRASIKSNGFISMYGETNSMVLGCTNWSKAKLQEAANFGPAVVPRENDSPLNGNEAIQPGTCASYFGASVVDHYASGDGVVIYGKDRHGDYRAQGLLRKETWDLIRKEISRYT